MPTGSIAELKLIAGNRFLEEIDLAPLTHLVNADENTLNPQELALLDSLHETVLTHEKHIKNHQLPPGDLYNQYKSFCILYDEYLRDQQLSPDVSATSQFIANAASLALDRYESKADRAHRNNADVAYLKSVFVDIHAHEVHGDPAALNLVQEKLNGEFSAELLAKTEQDYESVRDRFVALTAFEKMMENLKAEPDAQKQVEEKFAVEFSRVYLPELQNPNTPNLKDQLVALLEQKEMDHALDLLSDLDVKAQFESSIIARPFNQDENEMIAAIMDVVTAEKAGTQDHLGKSQLEKNDPVEFARAFVDVTTEDDDEPTTSSNSTSIAERNKHFANQMQTKQNDLSQENKAEIANPEHSVKHK